MRRLVPVLGVCLALGACDGGDDGWLPGYAESAPAAGWLESVPVQRGERVDAGALLFSLEAGRQRALLGEAQALLERARSELADLKLGKRPEEIARIEANLAEARAALTYAEQDLERQSRLARRDFAAEARARVSAMQAELATARLPGRDDQIAAAVAEVAMREAVLAQAQWELAQRIVQAPMAAIVDNRIRDTGEWVDAGGIVVSLLPPGKVKVRFFVPEAELGRLRLGQQVALRCDGCTEGIMGTVRFIAPEAEYTPPVIYSVGTRDKLVFMVEAWPADGAALHPGQPVDVRLR